MFGVIFTQAAMQNFSDAGLRDGEGQRYYGTVPRSIYTLFKSITGGVDWQMVSDPLSGLGWSWAGLFIIYISFTYFAVLNVVTGVFCQTAIESAQRDQDMVMQAIIKNKKYHIEKVRTLFQNID